MKKVLYSIAITFAMHAATAQDIENIAVMGPQVFDFIAKEGYKYPSFQKGKVYFINSDSGGGRLNYNYLLQTMQFIGEKGDTLVFADEKNVNYVAIGNDTFIYDNGFYEKMPSASRMILAKKHSLKLKGEPQKLGAFGIATATNNIPSEDVARGFGYSSRLYVNEQFNFASQTAWFVRMANNHFVELNKKNLQRLFQDKTKPVNDFIKEQKISLDKEEDVLRLTAFIDRLH